MVVLNAYKKNGQIYANRINGHGRVSLGTKTRIRGGRSLDMVLGRVNNGSGDITISSDAPVGFEELNEREEKLLRRVVARKYRLKIDCYD